MQAKLNVVCLLDTQYPNLSISQSLDLSRTTSMHGLDLCFCIDSLGEMQCVGGFYMHDDTTFLFLLDYLPQSPLEARTSNLFALHYFTHANMSRAFFVDNNKKFTESKNVAQ